MSWSTFDSRRTAWHRAKLLAALHALGLLAAAALGCLLVAAMWAGGWETSREGSLGSIGWALVLGSLGIWRWRRVIDAGIHEGVPSPVWNGLLGAAAGLWELYCSTQAESPFATVGHGAVAVADLAIALVAIPVERRRRAIGRWRETVTPEAPADEQQVIDLVRRARAAGKRIRIHGSDHSVLASIAEESELRCIHVSLVRLNRVMEWNDADRRVRVQAGCVLGVNPAAPESTAENSLFEQMDARGWALPLTGGITHQTVGGFLMTGSSGGSATHSLGDSIVSIRLVDGRGEVQELAPNPEDPDDEERNPFYAAGVSLGLLGVITEVTFQCVPRFEIEGREVTTSLAASGIGMDSSGANGIAETMRHLEYGRLMWWPQRGVERLQVWGAAAKPPSGLTPRPYVQVPGGRLVQALMGAYFLWANTESQRSHGKARWMSRIIAATTLDSIVTFRDAWHRALPMDNEIDNDLMPAAFSELWIDLERADEVGRALADFYRADEGHARAGSFACELYAAKGSRFWLSPAYGKDTIRVDLMHVEQGSLRPELDYFPQFWALLREFQPRFHWGKLMPPPGELAGPDYFARAYPRSKDFLAVRERFDPDQVFVNAYWRSYFGLRSRN